MLYTTVNEYQGLVQIDTRPTHLTDASNVDDACRNKRDLPKYIFGEKVKVVPESPKVVGEWQALPPPLFCKPEL